MHDPTIGANIVSYRDYRAVTGIKWVLSSVIELSVAGGILPLGRKFVFRDGTRDDVDVHSGSPWTRQNSSFCGNVSRSGKRVIVFWRGTEPPPARSRWWFSYFSVTVSRMRLSRIIKVSFWQDNLLFQIWVSVTKGLFGTLTYAFRSGRFMSSESMISLCLFRRSIMETPSR